MSMHDGGLGTGVFGGHMPMQPLFSVRRRSLNVVVPHDGYVWLKYGEKALVNTGLTRAYFKCAGSREHKCQARKWVDYDANDYVAAPIVKYKSTHNHKEVPLKMLSAGIVHATQPIGMSPYLNGGLCSVQAKEDTRCHPNVGPTTSLPSHSQPMDSKCNGPNGPYYNVGLSMPPPAPSPLPSVAVDVKPKCHPQFDPDSRCAGVMETNCHPQFDLKHAEGLEPSCHPQFGPSGAKDVKLSCHPEFALKRAEDTNPGCHPEFDLKRGQSLSLPDSILAVPNSGHCPELTQDTPTLPGVPPVHLRCTALVANRGTKLNAQLPSVMSLPGCTDTSKAQAVKRGTAVLSGAPAAHPGCTAFTENVDEKLKSPGTPARSEPARPESTKELSPGLGPRTECSPLSQGSEAGVVHPGCTDGPGVRGREEAERGREKQRSLLGCGDRALFDGAIDSATGHNRGSDVHRLGSPVCPEPVRTQATKELSQGLRSITECSPLSESSNAGMVPPGYTNAVGTRALGQVKGKMVKKRCALRSGSRASSHVTGEGGAGNKGSLGAHQNSPYRSSPYQSPFNQSSPYQRTPNQSSHCQSSTNQSPPYQSPTYRSPTYKSPIYQSPTYQGPTYQSPTNQSPPYQSAPYQSSPGLTSSSTKAAKSCPGPTGPCKKLKKDEPQSSMEGGLAGALGSPCHIKVEPDQMPAALPSLSADLCQGPGHQVEPDGVPRLAQVCESDSDGDPRIQGEAQGALDDNAKGLLDPLNGDPRIQEEVQGAMPCLPACKGEPRAVAEHFASDVNAKGLLDPLNGDSLFGPGCLAGGELSSYGFRDMGTLGPLLFEGIPAEDDPSVMTWVNDVVNESWEPDSQ